MEKKMKKPYVRPVSTCMVVELESSICTASEFQVQSPHGNKNGIEAQKGNETFDGVNEFAPESGWDVASQS